MTQQANETIVRRLCQTALTAERSSYPPEVSSAFVEVMQPLLAGFGINCELIEIYSVEKRCRSVDVEGRHCVLFDHALLDQFDRLDRVSGPGGQASFTATAFQRVLAEAARRAQNLELYSFFTRRALEIEPLLRRVRRSDDASFARFWQAAFVLCHEAAHVLPPDHKVREALALGASTSVSSLINELIAGMTGQLNDLLNGREPGRAVRDDVEAWLAVKDDLNVGDDAIFATFEAVGTDPRFLDEVACDRFAVTGIQLALAKQQASNSSATFAELVPQVLTATHRGFLHHRLLNYIDDILRELPTHLAATHVEPLELRLMVEMGFRANLVVLQMLSAASDLAGEAAVDPLNATFAAVQAHHLESLFAVTNRVIEVTVLDDEFHKRLPAMLAEDNVDIAKFEEDRLASFDAADLLWQRLVGHAGSPTDRGPPR